MSMPRVLRPIGRELARPGNLRRFSRAPRYRARLPVIAGWGVLGIVAAGLLVGLGYLAGHGPPARRLTFWDSLYSTVTRPSVSLPLAFAILTGLAYCWRRLALEWLGWRPGRIQVPDFSASNLTAASPAQLTIAFRDRLARMRLASSGAAPSAPPETDFLNVLSAAQVSSSNILGTLLGLLRAAAPGFAYEIRGVVVQRAGPPPDHRVSLQIVRLPSEGGGQVEVTDTDLDRAIRRAADAATAAILPRTHLCKGPWVAWRRYVMPGGLFNAYEDACEAESQRRYDQARDLYYKALEYDPMNRTLRLQLGQLQEKLHLPLEALATYAGMIEAAHPAGGTDLPAGLYARRAERERRRALLIARYRCAVLLGEASLTVPGSRGSALRIQLGPWLQARFEERVRTLQASEYSWPSRQLLRDCALEEVDALGHDLPLGWTFLRRPPLTRRALKLTRLCIEQRKILEPGDGRGPPTPVETLDAQVRGVKGWRRLRRFEEQYNAACLFAIPLLADRLDQELLAGRAVDRLELAAACADSAYIALRRDWITSEDPDLEGLRRQPSFKAFESQYFPSGVPVARRPKSVQELAELRCTRDLLAAAARAREAVWRTRTSTLQSGATQEAVRWWRDEQEVWRQIHAVAHNRDWRARLDLAHATRTWPPSPGVAPVDPVFERYEKHALAAHDDQVDAEAKTEIDLITERLDKIDEFLSQSGAIGVFEGFIRDFSALDVFDAEPAAFTPAMRSRICAREAAVWRRLHEWLVPAEGPTADDVQRAFQREVQRSKRLWRWTSRSVRVHRVLRGELQPR